MQQKTLINTVIMLTMRPYNKVLPCPDIIGWEMPHLNGSLA